MRFLFKSLLLAMILMGGESANALSEAGWRITKNWAIPRLSQQLKAGNWAHLCGNPYFPDLSYSDASFSYFNSYGGAFCEAPVGAALAMLVCGKAKVESFFDSTCYWTIVKVLGVGNDTTKLLEKAKKELVAGAKADSQFRLFICDHKAALEKLMVIPDAQITLHEICNQGISG